MSVLCVTLHFFTNHLRSREPQGCFPQLLLSSHTVRRNISPQPSVVKPLGFFLMPSVSSRQQDCNGLWALFQQLGIPPSLSPFLRNPTNKWVTDQSARQAISQLIRANRPRPPCTPGSSRGQLLRQEGDPRPSTARRAVAAALSPSAPSQLSPPWPSAPAAKPRGQAVGMASVLFRVSKAYWLVA